MNNYAESLVNLLTSLPSRRRRAWTRRHLRDTVARELVETATELVASPQPHESSQLCSVVIGSAEPLLAPHAKSLRRAVLWCMYRYLILAVLAVVVCGALFLRENKTTQVTQINTIQTHTTPIVVEATSASIPVSHASAELGERREVLPLLVAFTKGAMDDTLGLSRDGLSPSAQQHRDIIATQLDTLNLADAAEAMRRNHLGLALAAEVAAMREIGLDPEAIPPETLPTSLAPHDLARRLATDGTAAIITQSLAVQLVAGGDANSGGSSSTSDGVGSGAVSTATRAWGELPTREETLRQRSELPLIPAKYWGAVQLYLERIFR